jgi:hypothetical protein
MNVEDEITNLRFRPPPSEEVTLSIPIDALASLEEVARARDMSPEALLKFYIGHGLRQDVARLFSERILDTTARVLARHTPSENEREAILREIQGEAAA